MSIRMITTVLVALCLLPLAASAETTQTDYESAYEAATTVHEEVVARQNEWLTTNNVLAAAEKAAAAGNYDKATTLAHKAEELAQLALQQAKHQETAWKDWKRAVMN